MIDRRPTVIVRCASVVDVRAALRAAREHDLEIGVRCGGHGGHGVLGLSVPENGIMIDLPALGRPGGSRTPSGLVGAAEDENPELYWGSRGGGGNFGIVTDFEFRLHSVEPWALTVELDLPVNVATGVLAGWRDLSAAAPKQATFAATVNDGIVTVGFVWVGDPEAGRRHALELRSLGTPVEERIVEHTYVGLQPREDSIKGHELRRYWKGHYFRELPDAALAALLEHHPAVGASLQAYGGAIADVADEATAFSQRHTAFEYVAAARWTDPSEDADRMAQARDSAARLASFASGAYVNVLSDEGAAGVSRAYSPAKLARLTALKNVWDPGNVFHLNQNIPPAG